MGSTDRRRVPSTAAVATVMLLVTSGCTGGTAGTRGAGGDTSGDPAAPASSSSTASPAGVDAAAVTAGLARLYRGDHSTPDGRQEGRCFAEGLLDRVETGELVEAGVVGSDGRVSDALPVLDPALAQQWVAAQEGCVDFLDASAEALSAQSKGSIDTTRYRRCLDRSLTEDQARAAQVAAISGDIDGAEVTILAEAQTRCAGRALPRS